jgi:hypothetical protein
MGTHGLWGFEYNGIYYIFDNWYDSNISHRIALPQIYNLMKKYTINEIRELVKHIHIMSESKYHKDKIIHQFSNDETNGHPEFELLMCKIEEFGDVSTIRYGDFFGGDYQYKLIWNLNSNIVYFNPFLIGEKKNIDIIDVDEYIKTIDAGEEYEFKDSEEKSFILKKYPSKENYNRNIEYLKKINQYPVSSFISTQSDKKTITQFFSNILGKEYFYINNIIQIFGKSYNDIIDLFQKIDTLIKQSRNFDLEISFDLTTHEVEIIKLNSYVLIKSYSFIINNNKSLNLKEIDEFLEKFSNGNECEDSDYYDKILNKYVFVNPYIKLLWRNKYK